jgi:Type I phosphodiesterase / nucleotide pyrophosphatase
MSPRKKLVLAVIDGLSPATLERCLEQGRLPALSLLREHGTYTTATTTFPSVTPVCLSTIATGSHPDVHLIPHLVWFHRTEQRLVEYGSSLAAVRAVGARRSLRDAIVGMSRDHLSPAATTVFEAVEDAGLVAAAVNFTCYRGRERHFVRLPQPARRDRWYESVQAPSRFFFFNLYESDDTGAGLAVRSRAAGSVDAYAEAVGRWLVTRDGFDFLLYYLPDYDYAAHLAGPDAALAALERADACLGALFDSAGGAAEFLERYAIVVCSDHGQSPVAREATLAEAYPDLSVYAGRRDGSPARHDLVVAASNRAGMVYRLPPCGATVRELARRLDGHSWADLVLFRENGQAVARRGGGELRFMPDGKDGWRLDGDEDVLDPERYPDAVTRAWHALDCPRAGEILVSCGEGWEFRDLGGRSHAGGGSHGSLLAADSIVPVIAVGLDAALPHDLRTTDLAPLALRQLGVEPPGSMRPPAAVSA